MRKSDRDRNKKRDSWIKGRNKWINRERERAKVKMQEINKKEELKRMRGTSFEEVIFPKKVNYLPDFFFEKCVFQQSCKKEKN